MKLNTKNGQHVCVCVRACVRAWVCVCHYFRTAAQAAENRVSFDTKSTFLVILHNKFDVTITQSK